MNSAELKFFVTCIDRLREVYPDDIDAYCSMLLTIAEAMQLLREDADGDR